MSLRVMPDCSLNTSHSFARLASHKQSTSQLFNWYILQHSFDTRLFEGRSKWEMSRRLHYWIYYFLENIKEPCFILLSISKHASLRVSVWYGSDYVLLTVHQTWYFVSVPNAAFWWSLERCSDYRSWLHLHTDYPKMKRSHLWSVELFFTCGMASLHEWITELAY